MSENNNSTANNPNDPKWENFQPVPPKEHFGCGAWLGLLLLLGAIGAVLYYLVIKPDMEKKGVDMDTKISELKDKASVVAGDLKDKAGETLDAGLRGAENARQKAGEWWDKAGKKTEKAADNVNKVRKNAAEMQEKTSETVEKVQKKAEEKVESWY